MSVVAEVEPDFIGDQSMVETVVAKEVKGKTGIGIYERTHLDKLLKEHGLSGKDIVNDTMRLIQIGELRDVQAMLLVVESNFSIGVLVSTTLTFKLIDLNTGENIEMHVENPSKVWPVVTDPKSEFTKLVEKGVTDFSDNVLRPRSPEKDAQN